MKKLMFLILILPFWANAQNIPGFVKSEDQCLTVKNHINGKLMKTAGFSLTKKEGKYDAGLGLSRIDDVFSLYFKVLIKDYDKDVNLDSVYLTINYADGKIIKLSSSQLTSAGFEKNDFRISFMADDVSEAISAFKNSMVTKISLDLTNSGKADYTVEIAASIVKQIRRAIACISEK